MAGNRRKHRKKDGWRNGKPKYFEGAMMSARLIDLVITVIVILLLLKVLSLVF
jgi:hypothetical protein